MTSTIEIGVSTACFYPLETIESLKRIGELGFRKIELFINAESELEKPNIALMKKICMHYGICVLSIHFYTASFESMMFFSSYERRTKDSIKKYARYFEALCELSPSALTFHGERATLSGVPMDQLPFSRITEIYNDLCASSKPYGIEISLENVAWCRSKSPEYITKLRETVPPLRFTLDIKQAVKAGYSIESYLSAMGNALSNIHISDYNKQVSCLLPGKGEMDYYSFFNNLKHQNYNKNIIIEVYSSDILQLNDIIESGSILQKYITNQQC